MSTTTHTTEHTVSTRSSKISNQYLKNFAKLAIFSFVLLSLSGGFLLGAMHNDNRPTFGLGYIGQAIQFFFGGGSILSGVVVIVVIVLAAKVGARVIKSGSSNIIIMVLGLAVLLLIIDRFWPNVLGSVLTGAIPLILVLAFVAVATLVFTPLKNRH